MRGKIINILFCTVLSILTSDRILSQELLSVDWQNVVCTTPYISDEIYRTRTDNFGNTYVLGHFSNQANIMGETLYEKKGNYFFLKIDPSGNKVWAKCVGDTAGYTCGDFVLDSNGDIIIGINMKEHFKIEGTVVANQPEYRNLSGAVFLKFDSDFNLKWINIFQAKNLAYISDIAVDNEDNIYSSIPYIDSLQVGTEFYINPEITYQSAIIKMNSNGNLIWGHQFASDNGLVMDDLAINEGCDGCPGSVIVAGRLFGDSVFVDGILQSSVEHIPGITLFTSTFGTSGELWGANILDKGVQTCVDIATYNGKVYIVGRYQDEIKIGDQIITPDVSSGIFLGELNYQSNLVGFVDLKMYSSTNVTSLNISPEYGFVVSGNFGHIYTVGDIIITLPDSGDRGSFITSFNENFALNNCKYIGGGVYGLRTLSISGEDISGGAILEGNCSFANATCSAFVSDISTFKTTDLNKVSQFNPENMPIYIDETKRTYNVYPNPFYQDFYVKFNDPVSNTNVRLVNTVGQIIEGQIAHPVSDKKVLVDASTLPAGVYYLYISSCSNFEARTKIIKKGERQ